MEIVGYLITAIVGISLGLIGSGGPILTVPIFVQVQVFGVNPELEKKIGIISLLDLIEEILNHRKFEAENLESYNRNSK